MVQCQVRISIFFMHPPHPQFLTDFFQTFRVCLVHRVVQHVSMFFVIDDMRSAGGHDLVMLSLWENFQIAPIPKILDISAPISSLVCLNTPIGNNTRLSFSLLGVLVQTWGQISSTEVK